MEIVEVKCANCNKKLYVIEKYIREKMFCTLGCMSSYNETALSKGTTFH